VHVGGSEGDQQALDAIVRSDGMSLAVLSPIEAVAALGAGLVDVLTVDLMQTSDEVLALMRAARAASGGRRAVPVVVVAPYEARDRIQVCLQRGAADYLMKPFDTANPLLVTRRLRAFAPPPPAVVEDAQTVHRFIPREFLEMLERKSLGDVKLGDHVQRDMTIFFSDIRDFTRLSERLTPAENFNFLTSYLRNVTPIIRANGGFVDKYLGDGVMALFPEAGEHALRAGVELLRRLEHYNDGREAAGYVPIRIGMGLHRGSLILGTIGAEDQMQTTVIADAVNLASRIEGMTKSFGVNLLLSGSVVEGLPADHTFRLRALGAVKAKGKDVSVEIFECYDNDPADLIAHKDRTAAHFAAALVEFRKGMFLTAGRIFSRIAELSRDDHPAAYLRDRCSLSVVRERGQERWDGADYIEVN
jgi:two-component system sensor histidine kinase ChiS